MIIKFIILGNQEDPEGNPIPYHRTTQKAKWLDPNARRYEAWKSHVQICLLEQLGECKTTTDVPLEKYYSFFKTVNANLLAGKKPIPKLSSRSRCDIFITWATNAHGDPDNILKGINDALFQDDKLVACSVDFAEKPTEKARVDVTITL